MSALLEHFKPPPLASDPPAKTRYWPAPPKGSSGGILQRPAGSVSSHSQQSTCPSPISRVSFAPLPDMTPRKRRNSITLGVAARSAALRKMKEAGPPQQPPAHPGRRHPQAQYTYPTPAGRPRPRPRRPRGEYKDDQVVDLGEVAIDAGKKLWRVMKKSRKTSTASDSGRPVVDDGLAVGGPTVGVSGHNTEREILVRGFAVPEEDEDEDDEDEDEDEGGEGDDAQDDEEETEELEEEAQHRTEDYVAGIQAMHISEEYPIESLPETGKSPVGVGHAPLSPPPLSPPALSRSEPDDLDSSGSSSNVSTPSQQDSPPANLRKDVLF